MESAPPPELVFSTPDSAHSRQIHRAVERGELRKLAPRIFTSNLKDTPAKILFRHRFLVVGKLFPGAMITHRSALEGGFSKTGFIVLTYKYTKKITLPGLTIRLIEGPGPLEGDTLFLDNLYIASRARAALENLQPSRGEFAKSLGREKIDTFLDQLCQIHGESSLSVLRDQARQLAPLLSMQKAFEKLNDIISAILGSHNPVELTSGQAKARAKGLPYDPSRITLFAELAAYLKTALLPIVPEKRHSKKGLKHLAFFEAYFSNYIEGTEFEVSEAADIIFHHKTVKDRPLDAHDIVGTYQIISDPEKSQYVPSSVGALIDILKAYHHQLMSVRVDKSPGEFKTQMNRAGNTVFVAPELVNGTLAEGFPFYQMLEPGIARACFMMFLISEVHPFVDGNGRIARIMMNAELSNAKQARIIIPMVYREDYLLALKRLSRSSDPLPYCKMLLRAQAFVDSIDFNDYDSALMQLHFSNAFAEPHEGKFHF